jgi:hypothetical protein
LRAIANADSYSNAYSSRDSHADADPMHGEMYADTASASDSGTAPLEIFVAAKLFSEQVDHAGPDRLLHV